MAENTWKGRGSELFTNCFSDGDESLSIIDVDNMSDLSGSAFGLMSLHNRINENQNPRGLSSGANDSHDAPTVPYLMDHPHQYSKTEKLNPNCLTQTKEEPRRCDEMPTEKLSLIKTAHSLGNLLAGAWASDDPDISLHEVCLEKNELEQFDAEFSDLGDSDQGEDNSLVMYCSRDDTGKESLGLDKVLMPLPEEMASIGSRSACCDDMQSEEVVGAPLVEKNKNNDKLGVSALDDSSSNQSHLASIYLQPHESESNYGGPEGMSTDQKRGSNLFDDTAMSMGLESGSRPSVLRNNQDADHCSRSGDQDDMGVTDLAYVTSFTGMTDSAFLAVEELPDMCADEFVFGGEIEDKLEEDEKQFAKENSFIQDIVISSVHSGIEDSWTVNSSAFSHEAASDISASFMRKSVGQFIKSRTEVLGSLDGNTDERPHFGLHIMTPPDNHAPVPLLNNTSSDIPAISEEIRGSGVGGDVDQTSFYHGDGAADISGNQQSRDCTLTTDDLVSPFTDKEQTSTASQLVSENQVKMMHKERSCSPEGSSSEYSAGGGVVQSANENSVQQSNLKNDVQGNSDGRTSQNDTNGWMKDSRDISHDDTGRARSFNESNPIISLSTINDVLFSEDKNPEKVIDYVMTMTQAKLKTKVRQNSRERRKVAVEAMLLSSDSSETDVSANTKDHRSTAQHRRSVELLRKPADGKPTRESKMKWKQLSVNNQSSAPPSTDTRGSSTSSNDEGQVKHQHDKFKDSYLIDSNSKETRLKPDPATESLSCNVDKLHLNNTRPGCNTASTKKMEVSSRLGCSNEKSVLPTAANENSEKTENKINSTSSYSKVAPSSSLNSLTQQKNGSESTFGRCHSMQELGANVQVSAHGNPSSKQQQDSKNRFEHKKNKPKETSVMHPKCNEPCEDYEFESRSVSDFLHLEDHDVNWKCPRPSSVVCRSHTASSIVRNNNASKVLPSNDQKELPKTKKAAAAGKVHFQSVPESQASGSYPNLRSDGDCKPSNKSCKSGTESKHKWLSSTPENPISEYDSSQANLSHIVASAQDSILQNCTEPTLWGSQDKTKDVEPSSQKVRHFISKPDDGIILKSSKKSNADDFIQNSGSYRPARTVESNHHEPTPVTPMDSNPYFHDTLSPQKLMANTLSLTRLDNDHGSHPGLPTSHSTPFCHPSRSMMESRKQELPDRNRTNQNSSQQSHTLIPPVTTDRWGYQSQSISLGVPSEVRIPGVCCVGLSLQGSIPVMNSSENWLQLTLSIKSLSIDGSIYNPYGMGPFIYKETITVGPRSSEDVRVIFAPRQAGTFSAELELLVHSISGQASTPQIRKLVNLIGLAEKPSIQVYTGCHGDIMDFGSLPWGRERGLPLVLTNVTRANIPVRLVISSIHTVSSCFSFSRHTTSDIPVIINHTHPNLPSLKPTVINLLLPGVDENGSVQPVETIVYFRSPERVPDRALVSMPPEEFNARLGVELDTPYSVISLGSVGLRAIVGVARLHTPANYENIQLKTVQGKSVAHRMPLKNSGNIPLEVSLEVTHWTDVFTVIPMQLLIEAGGVSEVFIKFNPKQSHLTEFESLLLMYIEPDGPGYEMPIIGKAFSPSAVSYSPQYSQPSVHLLSNKQYLAWAGLPIGSQSTQTLILRNAANYQMKILLEIRDDLSQFQILSNFGQRKKLTASKQLILKPLEECPVHICFKPTRRGGAASKLLVRLINSTFKYSLPLSGHGGVSELSLAGVNTSSLNSCWLSVGHPIVGNKLSAVVTVHNNGTQAAYVKVIGFEDMNCKRPVTSTEKLVIQPSEFCISEHKSRDISIQLMPTEREASICTAKDATIMTLGFFYGDELSRWLYRQALKTGNAKSVQLAETSPLRGVNFDVKFDGEELIFQDTNVRSTRSDIELFYAAMKQLTLALVGSKSSDKPLTVESRQHAIRSHSHVTAEGRTTSQSKDELIQRERLFSATAYRDHYTGNGKGQQLDYETKITSPVDDTWTLEPQKLILGVKDDARQLKKLQIINYTDSQMNFELMWPGHFISVTPEHGIVEPKSNVLICVSAKPQLLQKQDLLPWSGQVQVKCNGQVKIVNIQIHTDDDLLNKLPPVKVTATPAYNPRQPITPLIAVATPDNGNTASHLRVTQQKLEFHSVKVQETAEQYVEIRNISSHPIRWNISSFVPPYFKPEVGDGEVFRVTYTVYRLPKIMGILEPHESVQISVCFLPRERGHYSQFWEIKSEVIDGTDYDDGRTHLCKLELQGRCVQSEDDTAQENKENNLQVTSMRQRKVMCKAQELTLSTDNLHFTVNKPGTQQEQKIKIGNRAKEVMKVTVPSQPNDPFFVKTTSFHVKPRHYLSYPVMFLPKRAGYFKGVLSLQKSSGEVLTVKLTGDCADE